MSVESTLRDGNGTRFELIETMRWQPGTGLVRLDRHLARLKASALELGFNCDLKAIGKTLQNAVSGSAAMRVRLTLARDGTATATAHPYLPMPPDKVWKLALARTTLDSSNMLLRHKTSQREAYVQARAEYPASEVNEVLLTNEHGEICEGTISTFFVDFGDGALATPHIDCGLLAGVLRAELIDQGRARETVMTPDTIKTTKALFVGNSLRGLIRATLTT